MFIMWIDIVFKTAKLKFKIIEIPIRFITHFTGMFVWSADNYLHRFPHSVVCWCPVTRKEKINNKTEKSYSNLNSSSKTGSGATLACVRQVLISFSEMTQYGWGSLLNGIFCAWQILISRLRNSLMALCWEIFRWLSSFFRAPQKGLIASSHSYYDNKKTV